MAAFFSREAAKERKERKEKTPMLSRIELKPEICNGRPVIRGTPSRVFRIKKKPDGHFPVSL